MRRHMKEQPQYEMNKNFLKKNQGGYIAFLSIVILGSVGGLIALTLYLTGINISESSLLSIQEKEARYLADSCSEIAIQQIINITENNSTSSSFSIGRGTCSFVIEDEPSGNKIIKSEGNIENIVRKNIVIINPNESTSKNTVSIVSWQETE